MHLYRDKLYVAWRDAFILKDPVIHGYILKADMSKYSFQIDKNIFYVTVAIASFIQSQF